MRLPVSGPLIGDVLIELLALVEGPRSQAALVIRWENRPGRIMRVAHRDFRITITERQEELT
jgi:hypothetical protein